jgi:hypothetical protein
MASFDDERRWQLPLLMGTALVLVAGSRFAPAIVASVSAFGFPLLALGLAVAPLRDSSPALRNLGFALAAVVLVTSELRISAAFELAPPGLLAVAGSRGGVWLLLGAAAAAAIVQAAAARRGMRIFAAAWFGMTAALAIYLPDHFAPANERFGQVLAALLVAGVTGGAPGLLAGAMLSALVKPGSPRS